MRSSSIHALAPGARIVIHVDPPITDTERPYVVTVRGRGSVVVQPMDTETVTIINPTNHLSLFYFFVERKLDLSRFPAIARFFGGL